MGRTTLEIDDSFIEAAMALSGKRTKTEAIELALRDLIRHREREALRRELGTFELDLDQEEPAASGTMLRADRDFDLIASHCSLEVESMVGEVVAEGTG